MLWFKLHFLTLHEYFYLLFSWYIYIYIIEQTGLFNVKRQNDINFITTGRNIHVLFTQ